MKSKLKRVLSVGLITGILSLGAMFTAWAADEEVTVLYSGKSNNITYTLYSDGLFTLEGTGDWKTRSWSSSIYKSKATHAKVNITGITTTKDMFNGFNQLTSIDLSGLETSNITDMNSMFYNCSSLTYLDVSGFDTTNVADMHNMFYGCKAITDLDVSGFNTSRVRDMGGMFSRCNKLTSINVSHFDTTNVTDMGSMFQGCNTLTELNINNFITSKVTNMSSMFSACNNLTSLDVSNFNTSNVKDVSQMFYKCSNLTDLDLSSFDTTNVTTMQSMFRDCSSLNNLNVSSFNTSKVNNMIEMFENCSNLRELDLSSFDVSNNSGSIAKMFDGCSNLQRLYTPINVKIDVDLPSSVGGSWYIKDTRTIMLTLPQDSNESILLVKGYITVKDENRIEPSVINQGAKLTANLVKSGDTSDIYYIWLSEDSEKVGFAIGKEIVMTEEIIKENDLDRKRIYCIAKSNLDEKYEIKSEMILVELIDSKTPLDSVSLVGETTVGETLTANVEPSDATVSYSWYVSDSADAADWTKIEGADKETYTLTALEIGKFIKVVVEGTGNYEGTKEVISINAIKTADNINKNIKLVVTNEDTGETPSSAKAGDTLVADIIEYDVLPDDVSYVWLTEDDDKLAFGSDKTITITDELIQTYDLTGRKIYCIAESNTDEEFKLSSEMILVKAADKTETNSAECNVIVSQGQSFSVTIPAFISMNGEKNVANEADFYTVVVADIAGGDTIEVKPVKLNVVLSQAGKKDLEAEISTEDGWNYEISKNGVSEDDLSSGVKRNHKISVAKLSAGRWRGTFNWSITTTGEKIKDSEEYVEYRQFDSATNEWKGLGRQ